MLAKTLFPKQSYCIRAASNASAVGQHIRPVNALPTRVEAPERHSARSERTYSSLSLRSTYLGRSLPRAQKTRTQASNSPSESSTSDSDTMSFSGLAHWTEEYLQQLAEASVVVASIPACPYCKRAKDALTKAGIEYQNLDVSKDSALREAVKELSGSRTVPQIFINGSSLGGSDDLQVSMSTREFEKLLGAVLESGKPALSASLVSSVRGAVEAAKAQPATTGKKSSSQQGILPDLAAQLLDPKSGVPRTVASFSGQSYRVFTGKQLVSWLLEHGDSDTSGSPDKAETLCKELLSANLITSMPPAAFSPAASINFHGIDTELYSLTWDLPAMVEDKALNMPFLWNGPAREAETVANNIRELILELYDKYLLSDGNSVSYGKIRVDPLLKRYVAATAELQKVDISSLNREVLMAMFINLYNALIIHALVVKGSKMSTLQRASFFTGNKYNIGGQLYSPDDIENGVLRGNKSPAANLFNLVGLPGLSSPIFKRGDARAAKVVNPMDPRIHFALVCGAKSCPPIKLYTEETLEEGLSAAGEAFCEAEVQVDSSQRTVKLSKIFKWYSVDFGPNDTAKLNWILPFLQPKPQEALRKMLGDGGRINVSYLPYDWDLNGED